MLLKKVSKKIVAITGSNGALGKHFIKKYKSKYKFVIYNKKIEDVNNFEKWIKKNTNIEIFVHFAAITTINSSNKNSNYTFKVNTEASINILKILNKFKLKKFKYFLFASTSHVYKPSLKKLSEKSKRLPSTMYGKSKKKLKILYLNHKKNCNLKLVWQGFLISIQTIIKMGFLYLI